MDNKKKDIYSFYLKNENILLFIVEDQAATSGLMKRLEKYWGTALAVHMDHRYNIQEKASVAQITAHNLVEKINKGIQTLG